MKIGLIGHGNIAKICIKELTNHEYHIFKIDDESTWISVDVVIITHPYFIFRKNIDKYKSLSKKFKCIFIPGNALNIYFAQREFGYLDITFIHSVPWIGRADSSYVKREVLEVYDGYPIWVEDVFYTFKVEIAKSPKYASNVFMHPLLLMRRALSSNENFYNLTLEDAIEMEKFDLEIQKICRDVFSINIGSSLEYWDSKNAIEFQKKLNSTTQMQNIKADFSTVTKILTNRYFLDDIDFKLRYLFENCTNRESFPIIAKIISWADDLKKTER